MLGRFADRVDAGRRLAEALPPVEGNVVVLGLARGGVPVAAEVARAVGAPLDVLVVRKVGHPAQPEYALGAVSEDGVALPDDLPPELVAPQLERARHQAQALRRGRPRLSLEDRVALETVGRNRPARVAMAVPVASGPGLRELQERWEAWAPLVVEPPEFFAVGQFYRDFSQVDDDEVAALLGSG
jgi:putative phosphoribosyl transferase